MTENQGPKHKRDLTRRKAVVTGTDDAVQPTASASATDTASPSASAS